MFHFAIDLHKSSLLKTTVKNQDEIIHCPANESTNTAGELGRGKDLTPGMHVMISNMHQFQSAQEQVKFF